MLVTFDKKYQHSAVQKTLETFQPQNALSLPN